MTIRFSFRLLSVLSGVLALATPLAAQHFDVFVGRASSGTQTAYGGIDVDTSSIAPAVRVFESEMGADPFDGTYTSDEPGFNHPADDGALPAGVASLATGDEVFVASRPVAVGGTTANLFYWNGTGSVAFVPAVGTAFVLDTGNATGRIGAAGAGGGFDDHPFFILDDGDQNPATFPAAGIYLASFAARVAELAPSDPLFLVMGTQGLITAEFLGITPQEFAALTEEALDESLDEVIEAAVDYVEKNVIPEPHAALLAAISAGWIGLLRRRCTVNA